MNIKQTLNSLLKHEYSKHIATLCTGTFLAQLISICVYPLLSRLFTPEDYGLLATLTQITSILTILSSCKYETNILIEDKNETALNLVYFTILLAFGILLSIFILTIIIINLSILPNSTIYDYIYIPFIMSFMIVIYQCYNEWCVRNKKFRKLSANKIINTMAIAGSESIFGLTKLIGGVGLVIGDMLGRIISAGSCIISFYNTDSWKSYKFSFSEILKAGKRNKDCPRFVMPAQLLNVLGGALPILIIGYYFGQSNVGLFSMANMVIIVPVSVMSLAIRDVFRQKASIQYYIDKQCKKLYLKNFYILSILSIIIFTFLTIIIKPIFNIFLGNQWIDAATYAHILMPMIGVSFVSDALSSMMIVGKKLNYVFYWQLLYFLLTGISLIIGGLLDNIILTLILFSLGRIIAYIINLVISYRIACGYI